VGGAENQAKILLPRLLNRGVQPFVVTRRFKKGYRPTEKLDNYSIFRIPCLGSELLGHITFGLSALIFLLARRRTFDIIHVHGSVGMGLIGLFISSILGKKIILKMSEEQKIGRIKKKEYGKWLLRFLKQIDMVVCINNKIYRDVSSIGFSTDQIARIPNGVDTEDFLPEPGRVREVGGIYLDPDIYLAVFSGRLVKQKGLDVLLKAWALFVEDHSRSLLLFLGTDALQREGIEGTAKRFVAEKGLSKHVMFLGLTRDVNKYLKMADVYVLPSRDGEGLSNALLEAMACGLPVIASDISGNQSILTNGVNGSLFPSGDNAALASRMRDLHQNADKARALGREARNVVMTRYSIDSVAAQYVSAYSAMMSKGCLQVLVGSLKQ
jgi:glycosyltransferase involved in cell wall biosynthesis